MLRLCVCAAVPVGVETTVGGSHSDGAIPGGGQRSDVRQPHAQLLRRRAEPGRRRAQHLWLHVGLRPGQTRLRRRAQGQRRCHQTRPQGDHRVAALHQDRPWLAVMLYFGPENFIILVLNAKTRSEKRGNNC